MMTVPSMIRNRKGHLPHIVVVTAEPMPNRLASLALGTGDIDCINDFKHILWDHLATMADFKLDIDYPYEIVKKEDLYSRPPRIPYNNSRIQYQNIHRREVGFPGFH